MGRVSRFSVEIFLCHSAEKFRRGESFSVSLFSGIKKYLLQRLMSRFLIFCRNFFVSKPKIFVGEPLCAVFQNFWVSKKFG